MSDFQEDNSLGRYIHWAGFGPAGSGKTRFLLTAPGPICVHLFNDYDGVSLLKECEANADLFASRKIKWVTYDFNPFKFPEEERKDAAIAELERFKKNYAISLRNFRTVGIDKEDPLWELIRYARLGTNDGKDRPSKYYEPNQEWAGLIHDAQKAGVNLGIIRGIKEKWGLVNGDLKGLGINEARGQRSTPEKVHVNLAHVWDNDAREFKTTIAPPSQYQKDDEGPKVRVGPAADLIGLEIGNFDFGQLAMALYPDTTLEDWGLA